MSPISDHVLESIRQMADLVEIMSSDGIELKRSGKEYRCLCPFHDDRNHPSMSVSGEKNVFYCFTCGAGGDVFSYIMQRDSVPFVEAAHRLAADLGLTLETRSLTEAEKRARRALDTLAAAESFFVAQLEESQKAQEWLASRGITREAARSWRIGFAPGDWLTRRHLRERGFTDEDNTHAGLMNDSGRFLFWDRVMIPVTDQRGVTVSFVGRTLRETDQRNPKYVNGTETQVFRKSQVLFGLQRARPHVRRTDQLYVTEGYLDAIAMSQHGFPSVVALMGTAMTGEQTEELVALQVPMTFVLDGDDAGREAAVRAVKQMRDAGVVAYATTIDLEIAKDPADILVTHGPELLQYYLDHALSLLPLEVLAIVGACDDGSPSARDRAYRKALKVLESADPDDLVAVEQSLAIMSEHLELPLTATEMLKLIFGLEATPSEPDELEVQQAATQEDLQGESPYHARLRRLKERYPRAYERWTDAEEERLVALKQAGLTVGQMAEAMDRHPGSIRARLRRLGLLD